MVAQQVKAHQEFHKTCKMVVQAKDETIQSMDIIIKTLENYIQRLEVETCYQAREYPIVVLVGAPS